MAGGRRLETPYGAVYAGNLTPDPSTGLGLWSQDDFHRAMHEGRSRDGRRLVPVFPYTSFTLVAREDNDALFAYLQSLPPVVQFNRPHELRFPYGTAVAMAAWQWLNFSPASAPERAPTDGIERGAYLVRGLGHCGECHSTRNRWSAIEEGFDGGEIPAERWYAPPLHPATGEPQSVAQVLALLRDGINDRGTAAGPMARVVLQSTQHWETADLEVAARYLHGLGTRPRSQTGSPASPATMAAGARLYADQCADCHGEDGAGVPKVYPPLRNNPSVTQPNIRNLVQILTHGGFPPSTAANPWPYGMPPSQLSTEEVAAVLSFVRQSWGQQAPAVSALDVLKAR
jgi:mono/diheme cytochrome c family protein